MKIAKGVLAGLFVGTFLGVLFAPAKGCETRKKLLKKQSSPFRYCWRKLYFSGL